MAKKSVLAPLSPLFNGLNWIALLGWTFVLTKIVLANIGSNSSSDDETTTSDALVAPVDPPRPMGSFRASFRAVRPRAGASSRVVAMRRSRFPAALFLGGGAVFVATFVFMAPALPSLTPASADLARSGGRGLGGAAATLSEDS